MSTQKFRQLLQTTINQANQKSPREIATLAHVLIYCLEQNHRYQSSYNNGNDAISLVISELELAIKKYAVTPGTSGRSEENNLLLNYNLDQAVRSYEEFISNISQKKVLTDNIIYWLLKGNFNDKFLKLCCKICREKGIDTLFLMPDFPDVKISELGFGTLIDNEWLDKPDEIPLFGRQADIEKHIGFLSLAIRQRRHYLLEGYRGVGKSLFLRSLIKTAIERWQRTGDQLLSNVRFILFEQKDFIYSEEDNRTRLTRLYQYLQANPQVIPIFDSFEGLLNQALSVHEIFTNLFGSILSTSGRTFVLVCRTEILSLIHI